MKQIYAVLEPCTRRVMYVGVSSNAGARVIDQWRHRGSINRTPIRDWMRQLEETGVLSEAPEYHVFEKVADKMGYAAERYYTEILCQINPDLLNIYHRQTAISRKNKIHVRGEDKPNHKLTEQDVREIRTSNKTTRNIAKQYGVSQPMIMKIKNRQSWKHVELSSGGSMTSLVISFALRRSTFESWQPQGRSLSAKRWGNPPSSRLYPPGPTSIMIRVSVLPPGAEREFLHGNVH